MRIISGIWRGRPLLAPEGQGTRPTSDRAREGLFSMLASRIGSFDGLEVADLFAGTGALGFEALSRGAAHCTFIEKDSAALATLRRMVAQPNNWAAIRKAEPKAPRAPAPPKKAATQDPQVELRRF